MRMPLKEASRKSAEASRSRMRVAQSIEGGKEGAVKKQSDDPRRPRRRMDAEQWKEEMWTSCSRWR